MHEPAKTDLSFSFVTDTHDAEFKESYVSAHKKEEEDEQQLRRHPSY